jgi:hypothetical protein
MTGVHLEEVCGTGNRKMNTECPRRKVSILQGHSEGLSKQNNAYASQCPGVYLGHPVPGGFKYGDLALQVGGVSRIGTVKYGLESRGTDSSGTALARTSSNSKLQIRPLVRESATK